MAYSNNDSGGREVSAPSPISHLTGHLKRRRPELAHEDSGQIGFWLYPRARIAISLIRNFLRPGPVH